SNKQYEGLLSQANSIIELAQQDYEQSLEKAQEDILSLSVHIAKKIIRNTLNDDPKSFMPLVSEAINEVKDQTNVSIYLHPENTKPLLNKNMICFKFLDHKLNYRYLSIMNYSQMIVLLNILWGR